MRMTDDDDDELGELDDDDDDELGELDDDDDDELGDSTRTMRRRTMGSFSPTWMRDRGGARGASAVVAGAMLLVTARNA